MSTPTATAAHEDEHIRVSGPASTAELDDAVRVFLAQRTRLLRVAYRVVGDTAAAEDVVQEAWVRWQRVDRRQINNPAAFLTTATTHLAINLIQSARHRHELPTETPRALLGPSQDPTDHADRVVTIERTLGFLMTKLSPAELAAFLLRKCFDYPYEELAELLGTSAPNVRQLVRRAHLGLASGRMRKVDREAHRRLVAAFLQATDVGHLDALVDLLAGAARRTARCPAARTERAPRQRRAGRSECVRSPSCAA